MIFTLTLLMAFGEFVFSNNESLRLSIGAYFSNYMLVFFLLSCVYLSKNRVLGIVLVTLIVLGTGINVVFNQYFGRYLMPYDIAMFFTEIEDTTNGLLSGIAIFYKALLWYLILYVFGLVLVFYNRDQPQKYHQIFLVLSLLFTLVFFIPVFKGKKFEVSLHYSVVRNSIGVYTHYLGNLFKKNPDDAGKNYTAYTTEKNDNAVNVIFIMGESSNLEHMSLYDYKKDTTPYLKSLAQNEPDKFKHFYGISRGFSTRIGVPLMLNVIQEPDNTKQLLSLDTNLFHLASQNNYSTYYLSNQKSGVLASLINGTDIDQFHDVNSKLIPQQDTTDMRLIQFLEQQSQAHDFNKPFFVVLHQRNHHFAYDENYPEKFNVDKGSHDEKAKLVDTYDNSMRFQDEFIRSLIETTKKITDKPTLIVYTSDHGELFGYDGLWGHGAPILQTASVPIFIYSINGAEKILQQQIQSNQCVLGNYQLGKFVASALGWNIKNPNEVSDYFVNIALPYDDIHGYKKFTQTEVTETFCKNK